MKTLSLNGSWFLQEKGSTRILSAQVPGCVHTDLLAAGDIPDPWFRDNEKEIHWIWTRDWVYRRTFEVSGELLAQPLVRLEMEGLDTLATVYLNGREILRSSNMFQPWELDVKNALIEGKNEIEVHFESPRELMKRRQEKQPLPAWNLYHPDFAGKSYVRKMACSFGWDWGLAAPTAGIWKPIQLRAGVARWSGVRVRQEHRDEAVTLHLEGRWEGAASRVRCRLRLADQEVGMVTLSLEDHESPDHFAARLKIENPQLWWPNDLGDQPLYSLDYSLLDDQGTILAQENKRIGLRTLKLIRNPDEHGESFRFSVNGQEIFAKGANWIPGDIFPSRINRETLTRLLDSSAEAHFNMIRVWGGGIYESDTFYDLCDERGILVWQDFMFACSTYPSFDPDFLASVEGEAVAAIRRLRHHPSLALWCGNNEIEQGFVNWSEDTWNERQMSATDYRRLFDELLPAMVSREDDATPYWPGSPHTPGENRPDFNHPRAGDAHAWSVWFGGASFEDQREWPFRFMSEFGFQSFPEEQTVASFTQPADRFLNSWIMDFHQRSGPGNGTIYRYLLDWFPPPADFSRTLWLTQLTQALCIQYAAEHARRIQGQMDGLLYWQLNDLWPGATWSSIDVFGRWKALHFLARRFFAPVLVSLVESRADSSMVLHLSNQTLHHQEVTVHWEVTRADGEMIMEGREDVRVARQKNEAVRSLDLTDLRKGSDPLPLEIKAAPFPPMSSDRNLLVWAWAEIEGREVSRNLGFFAPPKYWNLREPSIRVEIKEDSHNEFSLQLTTDFPSPWTRLSLTGRSGDFSDNFFHLHPRRPLRVKVKTLEPSTVDQLRAALTVTPLKHHWETT